MGRAQKLKQQRKEEAAKRQEKERKERYRTAIVVVVSVLLIGLTVFLVFLVNAMKEEESGPKSDSQLVLETSKGQIVIDLYTEDAPLTVDHITGLVEQGFYDNLRWYRVENFVVQTGSHVQSLLAESGDAQPDENQINQAYTKDQEAGVVVDEIGLPNVRGAVGMAKPSDQETQQPKPNSATTDFYILKTDEPGLDAYFTVFGEVVKGMDVVDSLETTDYLISAQIKEK